MALCSYDAAKTSDPYSRAEGREQGAESTRAPATINPKTSSQDPRPRKPGASVGREPGAGSREPAVVSSRISGSSGRLSETTAGSQLLWAVCRYTAALHDRHDGRTGDRFNGLKGRTGGRAGSGQAAVQRQSIGEQKDVGRKGHRNYTITWCLLKKDGRVERSSKQRGTKARMGRVGSNAGKNNSGIIDGAGRGKENDRGGEGGGSWRPVAVQSRSSRL